MSNTFASHSLVPSTLPAYEPRFYKTDPLLHLTANMGSLVSCFLMPRPCPGCGRLQNTSCWRAVMGQEARRCFICRADYQQIGVEAVTMVGHG